MIAELFLTKFSIILRISPSCHGGIETQALFCLLIVVPCEGTSVGSKGKLISSCVYFSCYLSFFLFQPGGVLVCSQHLGQGLGIVWLYLKTQREVCGPAPLNPDRLSFAWCGCQVDALASLPRTDEIITHLKKHVFLNFRQDNSCQMCDWCRPSLCHKVPHLIAVWIIKLL